MSIGGVKNQFKKGVKKWESFLICFKFLEKYLEKYYHLKVSNVIG